MDKLRLMRGDDVLLEVEMRDRPVEVGSGAGVDLVVSDPLVAPHELVVLRRGGSLCWYSLRNGVRGPNPFGFDAPVPLGAHRLVRVVGDVPWIVRDADGTDATPPPARSTAQLAVLVGHGRGARALTLQDRPVTVGSDAHNGLALADRAVSRSHARFDPMPGGMLLRDLGSRNGTFVDGVRVERAFVGVGSRVRMGRTDLFLVRERSSRTTSDELVFESSEMARVLSEAERAAAVTWPVLITGPSGAGKEGIARAIHRSSARATAPFVAINAGGIPPHLVESELFGHERGAFTGAVAAHRGVFEQAMGGTLFLDEVGELSLPVQARLLRVLETWEVRRVGAERETLMDVRLLCATHRDLRAMIRAGAFREDLFYRMARVLIAVPPLAQRPADIVALANYFLGEIARDVGPRVLSDGALARLGAHPWPGNVRELRNIVCAAAMSSPGEVIELADVARVLEELSDVRATDLDDAQLKDVLARYDGNVAAAARALGLARTTLRDRLRAAQVAANGVACSTHAEIDEVPRNADDAG